MDKEYKHQWYLANKSRILEMRKQYYLEHKDDKRNYYKTTPIGRALYLISGYKREDRKYCRSECDFDAKWMVENIMSKPCAHCGETDWHKIGCNRLDNTKGHTKDNVEPCCAKCNRNEHAKEISKQVFQYTLDGELVGVWKSAQECGKNGFERVDVYKCCIGQRKTHKGYRWSYNPL